MSATTTLSRNLTGSYTLDPAHSTVSFLARHAMVTKVRGVFEAVEGSGHLDAEHPERSELHVRIQAASIDTRNEDRDGHLRSPDFLDVENHPEITFASSAVEQVDEERFRVTGDLTIRDTVRPVAFELELTGSAVDPYGNQRVGLEGSTTISRKDFGITWNAPLEAGGVLVSDKVTIEVDVSAIKSED